MGQALCCMTIEQSKVGIVETWGRYTSVAGPGCHCIPWVCGVKVAGYVNLRIQQLDVRCETKTKDNVFVSITVSVQYHVLKDHEEDAFYKLTDPHQQIRSYVFDVVRSTVPALILDVLFESKTDIAHKVKDELDKVMGTFGFGIIQALVTDIDPDEMVKRSMNEINAASRMRAAASEKAEAEKILQVKRAEADAESKYLAGLGIARQRQAITDGLRDSVLAFSNNVAGTSPKDVMDLVLVTQYFDTMKDIGASSKNTTIFMPHDPSQVGNVAGQIRDGFLQGQHASKRD